MLETFGLQKALESLAEFYKVANIEIKIKNRCEKENRFSSDVEIALFRIAQEALAMQLAMELPTTQLLSCALKMGFSQRKLLTMVVDLMSMKKNLPGLVCGQCQIAPVPSAGNWKLHLAKEKHAFALLSQQPPFELSVIGSQ